MGASGRALGCLSPPLPGNKLRAAQGGRLTSSLVTELAAQDGKIPSRTRSPPLMQADAVLWHPPGWQPLGEDLPGGTASSGGATPIPRTRHPAAVGAKQPSLFDTQRVQLLYLRPHPFPSSQRQSTKAFQTLDYFVLTPPDAAPAEPELQGSSCPRLRLAWWAPRPQSRLATPISSCQHRFGRFCRAPAEGPNPNCSLRRGRLPKKPQGCRSLLGGITKPSCGYLLPAPSGQLPVSPAARSLRNCCLVGFG